MSCDQRGARRLAAALFLAVAAPLAAAVAMAGGLLALLPLLLLLVPVLLLGRHPGLEAIERLRERRRPSPRVQRRAGRPIGDRDVDHPRSGLLIATALAKRGPPAPLAA